MAPLPTTFPPVTNTDIEQPCEAGYPQKPAWSGRKAIHPTLHPILSWIQGI